MVKKAATHFESVHPVAALVKGVHQMHGWLFLQGGRCK